MRTWILQRYQIYARVCLTAGLFLMPVVFHRDTVDVFNLVKITLLWVFGLCALALWLMWSVERGIWPPRFTILLAAGIFLGLSALATAFSDNPALSLLGLYHRYGGLVPFLLYAAVMVLIVGLYWERPGELREIARASAAASALMFAYVLIQAAGMDWIEWRDPSGELPVYPVGTMGNSNFAGAYLGISVPFFLYVARTARRPFWKTVLTLFVGLDLLALWYTQTRGGMIAAGAGLTAMAFLYRDRLPRWIKASVAAVVTALALAAMLVVWHPGADRPPTPLVQAETFRTDSFTIRTYYWGTAWRIFLDNPILGTGLETYYANYPLYRLPEDGANLGLTITDKPHNIYLEYAANGGLLVSGAYLALVGVGLWYGYRQARRLDGQPRLLLVTFTAVLVGYLAQGFFSIDVPPLAVMGWVALGGIAAMADPNIVAARQRLKEDFQKQKLMPVAKTKLEGNPRNPGLQGSAVGRGSTRWLVHGPAALATALIIIIGLRPVLADVKAKSAQLAEIRKAQPQEIASHYRQAIRLHPLEPSYRALLGGLAEQQAGSAPDLAQKEEFLEQALAQFEAGLRLQPGNIFFMLNLARVLTTWAETIDSSKFVEADRWWRRAAVHDPTDWVVHDQYSLMLNSWANETGDISIRRLTAEQLEKVTRLRPDFVPGWLNLGKVYRALGETERARAAISRALKIEPTNEEAKGLLASL